MKRIKASLLIALIIVSAIPVSAFAANSQGYGVGRTGSLTENDYHVDNWNRFEYNYEFESGPEAVETFGSPTPTDTIPRNKEFENVRRNKDAALNPPPYGIFSGDISTEASSLYHGNRTNGSKYRQSSYSKSVCFQ